MLGPYVELITYSYNFDDVTQLGGWNKFRGLCVDCKQTNKQVSNCTHTRGARSGSPQLYINK